MNNLLEQFQARLKELQIENLRMTNQIKKAGLGVPKSLTEKLSNSFTNKIHNELKSE